MNRQIQSPISEQIQASSKALLALVYGKEKQAVNGVTYKEIKLTLDSINESGYFDVKPETSEPEPTAETAIPANDVQVIEQIPIDQTNLQNQLGQPVQFLQDSTIDPAIVSMQPAIAMYHTNYNGGDLTHVQGKFDTLIPTQTYTNPNYANFGGGFMPPLPTPHTGGKPPQTNQTIIQTQFIQPVAQENNNTANENQTFDQPTEYAANVEHYRKSTRIHKNYNDENNYNQGFRPKGNRGSRGGYRGARNQGTNGNGIHQPREKKNFTSSSNNTNKFTNGS